MPRSKEFDEMYGVMQKEYGLTKSPGEFFLDLNKKETFDSFYAAMKEKYQIKQTPQDLMTLFGIEKLSNNPIPLPTKPQQNSKPILEQQNLNKPVIPTVNNAVVEKPSMFNVGNVVKDIEHPLEIENAPSLSQSKVIEKKPLERTTTQPILPIDDNFVMPQVLSGVEGEVAGIKENRGIDTPILQSNDSKWYVPVETLLQDNKKFLSTINEPLDTEYDNEKDIKNVKHIYDREQNHLKIQSNYIQSNINYLNGSIKEKYGSDDILSDLENDNKALENEINAFENLKTLQVQPKLKAVEQKIQQLNNSYKSQAIDQNKYNAEFASLKAEYDVLSSDVNKIGEKIKEKQDIFYKKYQDPQIQDLIKLKKKSYEIAKQSFETINDERFSKIKEQQEGFTEKQQQVDVKAKLEDKLNSGEITYKEYTE